MNDRWGYSLLWTTAQAAVPSGTVVESPNPAATFGPGPNTAGRVIGTSAFAVIIPEPSTFALGSIGMIGVLGYAWRRRRRVEHNRADH